MKRVLMIAHAGPLFGAVAGQLAEYGIETMTIEKEAITSREEAKKLAAGMGSFDGVIHSVLLDAEEYPDRLFEMEPQEWERWKETVFCAKLLDSRSISAARGAVRRKISGGGVRRRHHAV